ncbi:hypothetical protein DRO30_05740, partial [Candidatus Bathyarchaeota archaeon]
MRVKILEDLLMKAVDFGLKLGAEHVELKAEETSKTLITTKDGKVEVVREGFEVGVNIRVLVKGAWGCVSTLKTNQQYLLKAIEDAYKLAQSSSKKIKEKVKLAEVKACKDKSLIKPSKDPRDIPVNQK